MNIKETALSAAKKSGKLLIDLSKNNANYEMKNVYDILAEADVESEQIIINEIKKAFPNHDILSEERGKTNTESDYLWIIDPLDGTINFSRGIDEYCISIAVERNGELILGVIYQPTTEKLFVAEKGKGAFLNNRRIQVSRENEIINSIPATDNSSKIESRITNYKILSAVCDKFRHIRILGSGALHLAKIVSGNIDVYYKTRFNYWDYAAGVLMVREAGGEVTDLKGNPIGKNSKDILASNGILHKPALELMKGRGNL
ncbi:inositol monophosphatase [Candidatus Micrarchaeota archaeon]|nr:inositol monophosphatase [Candidatus Micrarchaeota archaeon]